jgi:hypothetical protein
MKKKLYFLTSFVLVLALSGAVHAADKPLPVENYSFEEDVNGEQITEMVWIGNVNDWSITDTSGWAMGWNFVQNGFGSPPVINFEVPDGNVGYFAITWHDANDPNNTVEVYQILDANTDGNVVIAENRRYTLTFNALSCSDLYAPVAYGALFYQSGPSPNGVNDVILAKKRTVLTAPTWDEDGYDGWEEIKITYIALPSAGGNGKKLGVKLSVPLPWYSGTYAGFDNVRVDWDYLNKAWDPRPSDGATYVSPDVNLIWNPGLWADDVNGHDVYFGSTWAEVNNADTDSSEFKGVQSPNEFDPGTLTLGETYYWRIDEVCEPGMSPPIPPDPNGKWKGDIWSFTIEGHARNPYPLDGAKDIEKNVVLKWTAGTESKYHDIYFGSTEAEVVAATTASSEYKGRTNLGTELYDTTALNNQVAERYHWRIDEVNTMTVKGYTWAFKVIDFILIDDFDFYANSSAQRKVWQDSTVGLAGEGVVWLNDYDPNYAVDGNSMEFRYWNNAGGTSRISETTRTYSAAQDWSYPGNKLAALELNWFGDPDNGPDPPFYVKLSDGSSTAQVNPGPNDVTDANMHTWLIPLKDFSGVTLSSITKITLGIGDGAGEGGAPNEEGTIYFDDIRLYPPRCMPDKIGDANLHAVGDFTTAHHAGDDCITDCFDLQLMVERDWLMTDSYAPTQPPDTNGLIYYRFNEGSGTTVANDGTRGSAFNGTFSANAEEQPDWTTDSYEGWSLDFDSAVGKSDDADHINFPNPNLPNDTNHLSMTAWMKLETYPDQWDFPVMIESRSAASDATGFGFCEWGYLCYWWNNDYWDWNSNIWPDVNVWTFVAVTIAPDEAKLYYSEYGTGAIAIATNTADHNDLVQGFTQGYTNTIGDNSINEGGGFNGKLDDVRIYDETLTEEEIMALAEANWVPLEDYRADIDGDQIVNLTDYSILADNWLEQQLWPKP